MLFFRGNKGGANIGNKNKGSKSKEQEAESELITGSGSGFNKIFRRSRYPVYLINRLRKKNRCYNCGK